MEYEKIKQLMNDMGESKLTDIDITFPDGTKISMKKEAKPGAVTMQTSAPVQEIVNVAAPAPKEEEKVIDGNVVKAPMVGTFYLKPSPNANPYVEIGKEVKVGETLCIIEAMKLMNEIESEYAGKVVDILVKDGDPVEYGTPLFVIK